jgi:surface-anchored protein
MREVFRSAIVITGLAAASVAAGPRVIFEAGHLDIDWTLAGGEWSAKLIWDEISPSLEVAPRNAVLVAKDEQYPDGLGSRWTRPASSSWEFTGAAAGDAVWLFPASALGDPILEPGFSTYGVPAGSPNEVRIDLAGLDFFGEGEGHVSVFTTTSLVHMASADGIGGDDFYLLGRGDHQHVNWIFSARGVYRVWLAASMLSVAGDESSRVTSIPQPLLFAVGVAPFELWLLQNGVEPEDLGATASPAGDAVANLVKYALGLPPLEPVSDSLTAPVFVTAAGGDYLALDVALNPAAEGIVVRVETCGDLVDWRAGAGHTVEIVRTAGRLFARDAVAAGEAARRFIRLAVELVVEED